MAIVVVLMLLPLLLLEELSGVVLPTGVVLATGVVLLAPFCVVLAVVPEVQDGPGETEIDTPRLVSKKHGFWFNQH